jgi:uvrD/REP helicase
MKHSPELLVYKASAGSGKTFTLAVEYIKLLIQNPRAYRNILAVTFTNKATTEMKERILSQLYGIWIKDKDSDPYLQKITEELEMPQEDIRTAAGTALHYMIHDYSRFRVETIDSFFQSVMRNLARELELGANLNIELNNMEVLSDAVDSMIEKLDRQSPVLYWLLKKKKKRKRTTGKITGQRLYQELPRNAASHFGRGAGTNERICRPILRNIGYKRGESRRFEKRLPRYSQLF